MIFCIPTEITCPDPGSVEHATRVSSDYGRFECGSTVTYTCEQNYHMVSGSGTVTCGDNQQWSPSVSDVKCKLSLGRYPNTKQPRLSATFSYLDIITGMLSMLIVLSPALLV